jgi:glycosyltransferase involved in cell wall biosynthesis
VIISRNEERNIGRCIESVFDAIERIVSPEIILVDSASTDRTVEIAKRYPIRILQLKHQSQFSPAAGRFIGFLYSKSDYVQFLDSDMILDKKWIENAIPVLEDDEQVAGVVGITTQEPYNTYSARRFSKWMGSLKEGEIKFFDGANLCKRSVLLKIGFYNPYLKAHEETELSLRITRNGYKILRLPYPMIHHVGGNESFMVFLKKKMRNNIGLGQLLRYHLNDKQSLHWFLEEYKFSIRYVLFYLLGLIIVTISYFIEMMYLIYAWLISLLLLLIFNVIESKSVKRSLISAFSSIPRGIYFAIGFLKPIKDPNNFPKDVSVIK